MLFAKNLLLSPVAVEVKSQSKIEADDILFIFIIFLRK